jgi:hypothetical protein
MELARRFSPMMVGLLLNALACRSEVSPPPTAPVEHRQSRQPDARPNPVPPGGRRAQEPKGAEPAAAADVIAYATARPILEKHCFRCHTTAGQKAKAKTLKHLSFDQYPPTGHHSHETGVVFRRVLLGNKAKSKGPTMPADDRGAVSGRDLEKLLAWADAFDAARGDQPHHLAHPPPGSR